MNKTLFMCLLLLFAVLPATGQWTDSNLRVGVLIKIGARHDQEPTLFLRYDQATLLFDHPSIGTRSLSVRFSGSGDEWTVYPPSTPFYLVVDPPWGQSGWTGPGASKWVDIRWKEDGEWVEFNYDIVVVPAADRAFEDTEGNTMLLWEGDSTGIGKPLILVEGFDPPSESAADESWPALYYAGATKFITLARKQGADILILNFADGGADMRKNEDYVRSAVLHITSIKPAASDSIRLAGISMGGVVARWALAQAEGEGNPLEVSHYVSLDSPHQGARMDEKLLDYVKEELDDDPYLSIKTIASRQMLAYNPYDPSGGLRREFYDEINELNVSHGYPKRTKNIGVAFSTGSSNPNSHGDRWMRVRAKERLTGLVHSKTFFLNSSHGTLEAGSYLPLSTTMLRGRSVIFVPWLWYIIRYEANSTFIPYVSALDKVSHYSRFDVRLVPSTTHYHDRLPDEVIVPLLYELDLFPPLAVSIWGPTSLMPAQTGTWTARVSGGTSSELPVTYRWEYQLTCPPSGAVGSEVQCGQWQYANSISEFTKIASTLYSPLKIKLLVTDAYSRVTAIDSVSVETVFDFNDNVNSSSTNYPNPFNPITIIRFTLSKATNVSVRVYDAQGREVRTLVHGDFARGVHEISFDGSSLSSGVYYYTVRTNDYSETHSVLLVK